MKSHVIFGALFLGFVVWGANGSPEWYLQVQPDLQKEPGIQTAIQSLVATGKELGIPIVEGAATISEESSQLIQVGGGNPAGPREGIQLPEGPEGFAIRFTRDGEIRTVAVVGGSVQGTVYGLYWLRDRLRIHREIPEINVQRKPAFSIRHTGAESEQDIHSALPYSANWVSGGNNLDYFPWGAEPEATENEENRKRLRELVRVAHDHGLKYLLSGDEFSYHPSFLEELGARLNPCEPSFWNAVQEKYRRLIKAVPEIDGVNIRTGEHTRVGGSYVPFDVMHEEEDCGMSLEERYRTYVQKTHEIVVGEFDKIYFHRTWVTNATEQHSDPEVYRRIFAPEVPTKNLFLSPYLSLADRWYYQPFNPTFNQTPHAMVVLLAPLDYHAHVGVPMLPSFPGKYFQEGIESILSSSNSNLVGVQFAVPREDRWGTSSLTAYTSFRLAWDPHEDLRQIAEDYSAIYLGPKAAPKMAEVLLLTRTAYEDGIYIKPVAESIRGNTLPHLRLTTFQRRGIPEIDRGREHIEWLERTMYAPSVGRIEEAIEYLDRGLEATDRMKGLYLEAAPLIEDLEMRKRIGDEVDLTRALVETNVAYVKTCYAYFGYRGKRDAAARAALAEELSRLKESCKRFRESPGFCYRLDGIETLAEAAEAAVYDLEAAEKILAHAPARAEVFGLIENQQNRMAALLRERKQDLTKVMRWRGKVDGAEVLYLRGNRLEVEHLQGDSLQEAKAEIEGSLPDRPAMALLRDLESPDHHPFILEQPRAENDFTLKILLLDRPPGYRWWEFEVYWLEGTPEEHGLAGWRREGAG